MKRTRRSAGGGDCMEEQCVEAGEHDGAPLHDYLACHYEQLVNKLRGYLGCPDLAADSLHDAWVKLAEMRTDVRVRDPKAYVFRVACNIAADRLRRERHAGVDEIGAIEDLPDPTPGPMQTAQARAAWRTLVEAVQYLTRRQQAIFVDIRLEELLHRDVAVRYGLSGHIVRRELRDAERLCLAHLNGSPATRPMRRHLNAGRRVYDKGLMHA